MTESESFTESVSDTVSDSYGTSESESWGASDSISSSRSETDAKANSTAIDLVPGDIRSLPATASGNTIGESVGTSSNMGRASANRHLMGDARWEPAVISGVGISESRQRSSGKSDGSQTASSRSNGISTTTQRGTARTKGSASTKGVAFTTSESATKGLSHSHGRGGSEGWSEALEPILADRPTAVHSLDNMRYMAGEVLRNFSAGYAAISLVDGNGLKHAVLKAAHVPDCKLTDEQFDTLRLAFLQRSPSAVPIEMALASLAARQSKLLQRAARLVNAEPEAPQQFRTKRKRKEPEKSVDTHGEKSPPEPPPVKGPDRRRQRP